MSLDSDLKNADNCIEDDRSAHIVLISTLGSRIHYSPQLAAEYLRRIDVWVVLISFSLILATLDPTDIASKVGYFFVFFCWFFVGLSYVALMVILLNFVYYALSSTRFIFFPLIVSSFFVVYALIALGPVFQIVFFGDPDFSPKQPKFSELFYCLAIEQVFLTLYMHFTVRRRINPVDLAVESKSDSSPTADHKAADNFDNTYSDFDTDELTKVVKIGNLAFILRDISFLSAEEHYVNVRTASENVFVRERFSSVVDRLPNSIGYQIHRSYWVSYSEIEDIQKVNGKHLVITSTGESLPISNARKKDFMRNYLYTRGIVSLS